MNKVIINKCNQIVLKNYVRMFKYVILLIYHKDKYINNFITIIIIILIFVIVDAMEVKHNHFLNIVLKLLYNMIKINNKDLIY